MDDKLGLYRKLETMKTTTMKSPAAVPMLLLAIAIGGLMFVLHVWPGLPSSLIETKVTGTLDMPNDSNGRK